MHPVVYRRFEELVRRRFRGGRVLEVGAVPNAQSLLTIPHLAGAYRIGVNLRDCGSYGDFEVIRCDANDLSIFPSGSFDLVLSNATLGHDPHFWKSLSEMRRVCRPGGQLIVGVPGFATRRWPSWRLSFLPAALTHSTPTFHLHRSPGCGDYYRFSEECVREVFLEGLEQREVCSVLSPPRIIGAGAKPAGRPAPLDRD